MGLIENISTLITEHGSSSILKERLLLFRDQMEHLQRKHDGLHEENERLKKTVADLTTELQRKSVPNQFDEHRGVLFKRSADGKVQPDVYCPDCRCVMTSLQGLMPFRCSKCKFTAAFDGRELRSVIDSLTNLT